MSNQADTLKAVPLDQLFSAPFEAASDAQKQLAENSADFIKRYALDPSGNVWMQTLSSYYDIPTSQVGDISGGFLLDARGGGIFSSSAVNTPKVGTDGRTRNTTTRLVETDRPDADPTGSRYGYKKRIGNRVYILDEAGKVLYVQGIRTLSIPFISLVNVPSLFINEVSVDFAMSIKTQSSVAADSSNQSLNLTAAYSHSGGYRKQHYAATTAVSSSAAQSKSDTNTESTYLVSMRAKHIEPPGLAALMLFITGNKDTSARKTLDADLKVVSDPSMQR